MVHDKWRLSASEGNLRAVQILVDLGIGVNQPHAHDNLLARRPNRRSATKHGGAWLLDHGAEETKGHKRRERQRRRGSSMSKLLVDRGAEILQRTVGWGSTGSRMPHCIGNWDLYDFRTHLGDALGVTPSPRNLAGAHENLIEPAGRGELRTIGEIETDAERRPSSRCSRFRLRRRTCMGTGLSDRDPRSRPVLRLNSLDDASKWTLRTKHLPIRRGTGCLTASSGSFQNHSQQVAGLKNQSFFQMATHRSR